MARLTKLQVEQLKSFYVDGTPITEICTALGITRETFYYHKKKMEEAGIDIDDLRLANLRSARNLAEKESEFLSTLISTFEEGLAKLEEIEDPEKRLETLTKYVTIYYKLKAPKKVDCKQQVIEAVTETIQTLAELAMEQENTHVIQFLHENSSEIINRTLSKK